MLGARQEVSNLHGCTAEVSVAEVLVAFTEPVLSAAGTAYVAQACGRATAAGMWEGWIEFLPAKGGDAIRSGRETTQPNRDDILYWATGLTPVYLEGALDRALNPLVKPDPGVAGPPVFDGPAAPLAPAASAAESVLNPFSVYRKGEVVLRRQLTALSAWHLVNIILAHELSEQGAGALSATPAAVLVELIVAGVKARIQVDAPD
jgi:hypothetical protein